MNTFTTTVKTNQKPIFRNGRLYLCLFENSVMKVRAFEPRNGQLHEIAKRTLYLTSPDTVLAVETIEGRRTDLALVTIHSETVKITDIAFDAKAEEELDGSVLPLARKDGERLQFASDGSIYQYWSGNGVRHLVRAHVGVNGQYVIERYVLPTGSSSLPNPDALFFSSSECPKAQLLFDTEGCLMDILKKGRCYRRSARPERQQIVKPFHHRRSVLVGQRFFIIYAFSEGQKKAFGDDEAEEAARKRPFVEWFDYELGMHSGRLLPTFGQAHVPNVGTTICADDASLFVCGKCAHRSCTATHFWRMPTAEFMKQPAAVRERALAQMAVAEAEYAQKPPAPLAAAPQGKKLLKGLDDGFTFEEGSPSSLPDEVPPKSVPALCPAPPSQEGLPAASAVEAAAARPQAEAPPPASPNDGGRFKELPGARLPAERVEKGGPVNGPLEEASAARPAEDLTVPTMKNWLLILKPRVESTPAKEAASFAPESSAKSEGGIQKATVDAVKGSLQLKADSVQSGRCGPLADQQGVPCERARMDDDEARRQGSRGAHSPSMAEQHEVSGAPLAEVAPATPNEVLRENGGGTRAPYMMERMEIVLVEEASRCFTPPEPESASQAGTSPLLEYTGAPPLKKRKIDAEVLVLPAAPSAEEQLRAAAALLSMSCRTEALSPPPQLFTDEPPSAGPSHRRTPPSPPNTAICIDLIQEYVRDNYRTNVVEGTIPAEEPNSQEVQEHRFTRGPLIPEAENQVDDREERSIYLRELTDDELGRRHEDICTQMDEFKHRYEELDRQLSILERQHDDVVFERSRRQMLEESEDRKWASPFFPKKFEQ
ncbi:hypothetical protein QR680_004050 [Steinernema hermaphroditum]|uniref:Uncharacterized protein n=1 Tax=Steinernema hermaphroditum TaxID=289476 RepID=A0AA39LT19_9BILA|nr:hypothetical protein QR680_004050 [Steinernema hermaphroditum]